jgi:hypothetical protein
MTSATIKLFLPRGDAKSLRTAEISNWTGKAVAAPHTELGELLAREELDKQGWSLYPHWQRPSYLVQRAPFHHTLGQAVFGGMSSCSMPPALAKGGL